MPRQTARSLVVLAVALLALGGCATIRRQQAADTEQLLAAAGFHIQRAESPEQRARLEALPRLKLVRRADDGKVVYTFADPEGCRCLYVGGPKEHSEYQRLRVQRRIDTDNRVPEADWGPWGPTGSW
jgi:uncharacterized protein YceK